MTTRTGLLAIALAALGCDATKPAPKLVVEARWVAQDAAWGCQRHVLQLDVATIALTTVSSRGVSAKADEAGSARLELRRNLLLSRDPLVVWMKGRKVEVAVPARPRDERPVRLGADGEGAMAGTVAWTGEATGAVVGGGPVRVTGVLDGDDLRFRFTGCDLKGGTVTGGQVATRGPDGLEVRVPLAPRLAAATGPTPTRLSLTFEAENLDGGRGTVTLDGTLDVRDPVVTPGTKN